MGLPNIKNDVTTAAGSVSLYYPNPGYSYSNYRTGLSKVVFRQASQPPPAVSFPFRVHCFSGKVTDDEEED